MEYAQIVGGNIDATWVLNGITGIACFLFWNQLKEIKEMLKEVTKQVQMHETEIKLLKHNHAVDDDEFFNRLVDKIKTTINAAKG